MKVKDICDINLSTISRRDKSKKIEYLDTSSITENTIIGTQQLLLSEAPSRAQRKVKNDTIVYSLVRPNLKHFGILQNPPDNLIVSTGFCTIDIKKEWVGKVSPYYLYCFLTIDTITQHLSTIAANSVSSYPSINPSDIENIEIDFPSYEQQLLISNIFKDIDCKLTNNRKQNAILEKLAKQIYDYWFVQFDFPDENGEPYKSSGGKMVWNETLKREIPDGWEVKPIGDICPAEKGSLITKDESIPGNIKVVAAGLDFSYYHNVGNRPPNTITISGSGENAGFTRLWREEIFASDCSTIVHNNIVDVYISYFTLKSYKPWLYRIARKSAQPHIYPSDVNDLPRIVAPANIISKIERVFHSINSQIALKQSETERLLSLRSYLLPLLMTGQAKLK